MITASKNLQRTQGAFSRFLDLSNLDPGKQQRTAISCYPLPPSTEETFCCEDFASFRTFKSGSASANVFVLVQYIGCTNQLDSVMKHVLADFFVGAQTTSITTHKVHRQWREREACRLSANGLAWSRAVAIKKSSVWTALTLELNRSLKCFTGLNTDFKWTDSVITGERKQSSDTLQT